MKSLWEILITSILFFSLTSAVFITDISETNTSLLKKVKPTPNYEYKEETKIIHFIDAICEYRVNNMHWDVIKEGSVKEKNVTLDLSELESGEYIIEIEYQGYVFVEDIFL